MLCLIALVSLDISTDSMSRKIGCCLKVSGFGNSGCSMTRPRESIRNAYDSCVRRKSMIGLNNVSSGMSIHVTPWNEPRANTGRQADVIMPIMNYHQTSNWNKYDIRYPCGLLVRMYECKPYSVGKYFTAGILTSMICIIICMTVYYGCGHNLA